MTERQCGRRHDVDRCGGFTLTGRNILALEDDAQCHHEKADGNCGDEPACSGVCHVDLPNIDEGAAGSAGAVVAIF